MGDKDGRLPRFILHDRNQRPQRRSTKKSSYKPSDVQRFAAFSPRTIDKRIPSWLRPLRPFTSPKKILRLRLTLANSKMRYPRYKLSSAALFPLIFIDPTGWKGYSFNKIGPLFSRPKCEVLINFMYDFVNRAASMSDTKTISSLDPILGGPGWETRLDPSLPRGRAVEKLFRDNLAIVGNFGFVVSTKIDRPTADRPHFFIAYGTKSRDKTAGFRPPLCFDGCPGRARA